MCAAQRSALHCLRAGLSNLSPLLPPTPPCGGADGEEADQEAGGAPSPPSQAHGRRRQQLAELAATQERLQAAAETERTQVPLRRGVASGSCLGEGQLI